MNFMKIYQNKIPSFIGRFFESIQVQRFNKIFGQYKQEKVSKICSYFSVLGAQ